MTATFHTFDRQGVGYQQRRNDITAEDVLQQRRRFRHVERTGIDDLLVGSYFPSAQDYIFLSSDNINRGGVTVFFFFFFFFSLDYVEAAPIRAIINTRA